MMLTDARRAEIHHRFLAIVAKATASADAQRRALRHGRRRTRQEANVHLFRFPPRVDAPAAQTGAPAAAAE
jgi:hypothetical protein